MKNIHPQYYPNAKIVCACGNTFTVGSTLPEVHVEICSNCHPFYTGKQHLLDMAGTIDKFKKRTSKSAELKTKRISAATGINIKMSAASRQGGDKKLAAA